jgi:hypothetical protein
VQPRKIRPSDQAKIEQIAKKTGIPRDRLEQAVCGEITLSPEDYRTILAASVPLPQGIKKPFGN